MTVRPEGADAELVRPMPWWLATAWTFGATFAFLFVYSFVVSARESARDDQVSAVLCQVVGYGLVTFAIVRVHAPELELRRFLALKGTSAGFYAVGLSLGLAATLPANALHHAIVQRFPFEEPQRIAELWNLSPAPTKLVLAVMIAGVGPVIEEVFFRGAIFGGLRTGAVSTRSAVVVSTVLFTIVHVRWQSFAPILFVGLIIAALRVASGSIVPSILAHVGFNAVGVAELVRGEELQPSPPLALGGLGLSAALMAGVWWLGTKPSAARDSQATKEP